MKLTKAVIWWTQRDDGSWLVVITKQGFIPSLRDKSGAVNEFTYSDGACWSHWSKMSPEDRLQALTCIFRELVVYHKANPDVVDKAFWKIDEWREMCANHSDRFVEFMHYAEGGGMQMRRVKRDA